MTKKTIIILHFLFLFPPPVRCFPHTPADAGHMTANAGDNIVFNCGVEFPGGHPVPYVVQWWKKVSFGDTYVGKFCSWRKLCENKCLHLNEPKCCAKFHRDFSMTCSMNKNIAKCLSECQNSKVGRGSNVLMCGKWRLKWFCFHFQGKDQPIYIWYDNYPTHADKDYAGRVSEIQQGKKYHEFP